MMNIDKYDRIVVSQEDVELLFEWRDGNKDVVRNFSPVLENGVIINKDTPKVSYVFQKKDNGYIYNILIVGSKETIHTLFWDFNTKLGHTLHSVLSKEDINEYNKTLISLHASLMAYMEHAKDIEESIRMKSQEIITGFKKHRKTNKKLPIKIRRKVYSVSVTKESLEAAIRTYNRHIEQWTVRGHWRKTKNGKVWIKPHVKGEGKEITPKEYKL